MVVCPAPTAVASPELLIVAAAVLLEFQVALLVILAVVLSAYVACAVYCCVVELPPSPLTEISAVVGVMLIDTTAEFVTVTVVVPLTAPEVAVIVAVPALIAFTSPVLLTVATLAVDVVQARFEMFVAWLPSLFVPVAVSCAVCPFTSDGLPGVMVMLCRIGFTKNPRQLDSPTASAMTVAIEAITFRRAARFPADFCKLNTLV